MRESPCFGLSASDDFDNHFQLRQYKKASYALSIAKNQVEVLSYVRGVQRDESSGV
jgi:hypothetical protein